MGPADSSRPRAVAENLGIDHLGGNIAVAEELLNDADVVAALEQVCGERVAERVTGHPLVPCVTSGLRDGSLPHCLVQMMAALAVAVRHRFVA